MPDDQLDPQADELLQRVKAFIRHANALDDEARAIAQIVDTMQDDPFAGAVFLAALKADRHDETLDTLVTRLRAPVRVQIVFDRCSE